MGVRINKELRDLLENEQFDISSPSAMLVRSFYRSCTNVSSMETLGLEPMKEVLKKYGGWPVVMGKEWNGTGYDWMVLNAWLMREVGQPYILAFGIAADYKNISKRILHIDQPSLGLGKRDYYVNADYSQFVDSYLRFMIDIAVQLGANETSAKSEMEEVLKFEKDLAEASARDEDRRDFNVLYNTMTIAELKGRHPKVNFSIWFDHMTKTGVKFDDSDVINLDGQPFVKKLPGLLSNYSSRVLANYQMWRLVQSFVDIFPPSQREHLRQFLEDLTGTPKFKERWEECIETLVGVMPMPVGALYVKKYFSEDSKKEADSMMNAIREAMKIAITSIDWMDRSTRNYSLHKLASMAELRDDQYFNNSLSLIASAMDRTFNELRIPINRMEWEEQIAQANAWYLPTKNKMVFPAGIFHYPLFAAYAPPYVNYGRIGSVMGHELTHGFDDTGRQFDADGNFLFWWTNETSAAFQRGAKCFIDQYSIVKDKTTGLNLNGENTQGENIADNGGVKLAYKAYQIQKKTGESQDVVLPYLRNYTGDVLRFLWPGELYVPLIAAGCALLAVAYRNTVYSSSPFTVHAAKVLNVPEGEKPSKFQLNFIADVVEAVAPAVVYIDAVGKLPFFGGQSVTSGSGFIVRSDGYILTNAHVVEGVRGGKLRVHLHDGTTYEGHVTYMDTTGDLALVRIHAKDLPALKLGDSSKSRPGEWVIAVGSPFSLTNSVTMGIISSVKRRGSDLGLANTVNYIQTDALITFGNSGGPLVNLDGEAIGINSMKVTDGISFAIPSDYAKSFLNQCAELEESAKERSTAWPFGKKKEDSSGLVRPGSGRRRIGITMMQLDEQTIQAIRGYDPSFPDVRQGVLVHSVVIGQPAFESGVRPGDVITHVNGRAVSTSKDLLDAVDSSAKLRLRVMRRSKILELEIIPAADASDM